MSNLPNAATVSQYDELLDELTALTAPERAEFRTYLLAWIAGNVEPAAWAAGLDHARRHVRPTP